MSSCAHKDRSAVSSAVVLLGTGIIVGAAFGNFLASKRRSNNDDNDNENDDDKVENNKNKDSYSSSSSSSFPYVPPKVWKFQPQGGTFGSTNRPSAGFRSKEQLPRGNHALQLYSLGTPNGQKVTCLLEELCLHYTSGENVLEYDSWFIGLDGPQFSSGFVQVNPNSKIPALLDYNSSNRDDDDGPIRVFESAAILLYLCETYDEENLFLPPLEKDPNRRAECLSWLFWVQGSAPFVGGGFGHFYRYAPVKIQYAIDRYAMETKRQLDVLERHLSGEEADCFLCEEDNNNDAAAAAAAAAKKRKRYYMGGPYLCGDQLTIADFACYPWYGRLVQKKGYEGAFEFLSLHEYPHVLKWANLMSQREGVRRGCLVNVTWGDEEGKLKNRRSSLDFTTTTTMTSS